MVDRLRGKTAIVFGAGSSGPGWGNGKAAAAVFAREGAQVACVDLVEEAAAETADIIKGEGGAAIAVAANVTRASQLRPPSRRRSPNSAGSIFCTTMSASRIWVALSS